MKQYEEEIITKETPSQEGFEAGQRIVGERIPL
jgi:hypothetical protein